VHFNVISKDLKRLGYEVVPRSQVPASSVSSAGGSGGGGGHQGTSSSLGGKNKGPADGLGLTAKKEKTGSAVEAIIEEREDEHGADVDEIREVNA